MRLLHTSSMEMKEFFEKDLPEYAILSHRWLDDEVSLQDFEVGRKTSGQGFEKIRQFCSLAASRGLEWAWIDTCCIDKKSSAELSEAINSMYRWYEKARECYAYLSDVEWSKSGNEQDGQRARTEFRNSKWFTRGWTLQELLAPKQVRFYDKAWTLIGVGTDKSESHAEESLTKEISHITKIDARYLAVGWVAENACIAVKMSWMARRETTRVEDLAYALMGLFHVNMPLLYGEGYKAFRRLQLEIIQQNDDDSIFAHGLAYGYSDHDGFRSYAQRPGILAERPSDFLDSGDVQPGIHSPVERDPFEAHSRPPYSVTNKGLAVHVPRSDVHAFRKNYRNRSLEYVLECFKVGHGYVEYHSIVICLKFSLASVVFQHDCTRIRPRNEVEWYSDDLETHCIYIEL